METSEKKILLVDDDKEFLEELKEMLALSGYKVMGVADSVAAVNAARVTKQDAILLDLRMQAMSGFEVADKLKSFPETSRIPVIAMTGFYTLKEHAWLMNFCGIKKCIKKPFNPLDMIAEIEQAIKEADDNK